MPPLKSSWERQRLRAPRNDGEVLANPPLADMPSVITKNRERIAMWDIQIFGKSLTELRRLAREEVLALAERFAIRTESATKGSSDIDCPSLTLQHNPSSPLIVSGHQPELFHRGVWIKNFVLDRLAKQTGGVGLHLIVDNDMVSSTRIAVPVGSREDPRLDFIPFDVDAGTIPWEEARLQDESLFRTFAERVSTALACWPIRPMISDLWSSAIEQLPQVSRAAHVLPPRLSDLLTIVRREAELRMGLNNLELPISQLCETDSFNWFVCHLLSDPPRTHAIYNEVVSEYRRIHRVRNRQHPVPDLARRTGDTDGDWLESPFWIWRSGDTHRGRLFVRVTSSALNLAIGETIIATLPRSDIYPESLVSQLREFAAAGWKLRPRALTNTLFVRVFFADAFLHGIGGAKYDEMTDRLIEQLFGIAPPGYLIVTATHRLSLGKWNVTSADIAALKHRLWDFDHNPERHVTESRRAEGIAPSNCSAEVSLEELTASARLEFQTLLDEKQRLIAEQRTQDALNRHDPLRTSHAENNHRRRRFKAIKQRLATLAHAARETIADELQAAQSRLAANAVLQNREFSFGLFPWDQVKTAREF